jgi:hypothetical protein
LTAGDIRPIGMDNKVVEKIINREIQLIRTILKRVYLLEDDDSRLALILSNHDSYR